MAVQRRPNWDYRIVDDENQPTRLRNTLINEGIYTLGDLRQLIVKNDGFEQMAKELLRAPNFGRKSLQDLQDMLDEKWPSWRQFPKDRIAYSVLDIPAMKVFAGQLGSIIEQMEAYKGQFTALIESKDFHDEVIKERAKTIVVEVEEILTEFRALAKMIPIP